MKIKAIIVEDEIPAQDLLKHYISKHQNIDVLDICNDGFKAVKSINNTKPDIIFLDIQIPKITGIELLELIDYNPVVIFTTAYDKYAINAFEQNAADYLLKPFSEERFNKAINKALDLLNNYNNENSKVNIELEEKITRIVVKNNNTIEIIPLDKIMYLEAQDDYIYIYTEKGRFLKKDTIKKYENLLSESFIRTHRSYIVNINFIDKLELLSKESYVILLKDKSKVKVSKSGYKLLKSKLGF